MDFAFKVDVDTRHGLITKVPRMLDIFAESGIKASFFVPFGPDRSGVAVRRFWERRGIAKKAFRINPISFYGFPTLFYGTLWPAPLAVRGAAEVLRRIVDDGHELGVHGYDHVEWHDRLLSKGDKFMADEIVKATQSYRRLIGSSPDGFAAPGWQMKDSCYPELARNGYRYSSSVRGSEPFILSGSGESNVVLEIPTTLPTLDEICVLYVKQDAERLVDAILSSVKKDRLNVHTVHAELEGGAAICVLKDLVGCLKSRDARFVRLKDCASDISSSRVAIAKARIRQAFINGRPGTVTCQA